MASVNLKPVRASLTVRCANIIGSSNFFRLILILLVAQSLWIALSGRYPMAFDEITHFGLIRVYSQHWLPFFSQTNNLNMYGSVPRDPSYLYHYILSFPYRIFAHFVHSDYLQIVFLRIINIAIFAYALVIFRKVLLFSGKTSKALIHGVLLFIALTPVVPLVAAQINYDSLFFLATALAVLATLRVDRTITSGLYNAKELLQLLIVCLLGSLVKYPFLPVFLAILIYLTYRLYRSRKAGVSFIDIKDTFMHSLRKLSRPTQIILIVLVCLSAGLFIERDGLNIVRYGTPSPQCNQVLGVSACMADELWARNYVLAQQYSMVAHSGLFKSLYVYKIPWLKGMINGLFFAIGGPGGITKSPLPLPRLAEFVIIAVGILLFMRSYDKVYKKDRVINIFLLLIVVYTAVLFLQNFEDYRHLGVGIGIQGRYLLPVLPLIYVIIAKLISFATRKRPFMKPAIFVILLLCMIDGGGVLTFISRSDASWYWTNSPMIKANEDIQRIINPIIG